MVKLNVTTASKAAETGLSTGWKIGLAIVGIITIVGVIATTVVLTKKPSATGATGKKVYNSAINASGNTTTETDCPIGKYKLNDVCTPCPDFKTTDSTGATSVSQCTKCLPGYNMVNEKCVVPTNCNIGYYKSNGVCVACPPRKTTSTSGATSINSCVCMTGYVLNPTTNECECPAGKYYNPSLISSEKCVTCPPNTVSTQGLNRECSCKNTDFVRAADGSCVCVKGKYLNAQRDGCEACPNNKTTEQNGAENIGACVCPDTMTLNIATGLCGCLPSQILDNVNNRCITCANPTIKREDGLGCTSGCPAGYYIDGTTGECKPCRAGTANALANQTFTRGCPACPPKTYASPKSVACTPCSGSNLYPDGGPAGSGPDDCWCDRGFYRSIGGACLPCPGNTTSLDPGAISETGCRDCKLGYFKTDLNAQCQSCPDHSTPVIGARDNITQCLCDNDRYLSGGTCELCPNGSHSLQGSTERSQCICSDVNYYGSAGSCARCPQNSMTDGGRSGATITDCKCGAGTYLDIRANKCETCPDRTTSDRGAVGVGQCNKCAINNYMINGQCVGCPNGATSPGGTGGFETCRCPANYYMKNGQCVNCPTNSISPIGSTDISQCRCFANFYMENGLCEGCPNNSYSNEGSTNIFDCKCDSYYQFMDPNAKQCQSCGILNTAIDYPNKLTLGRADNNMVLRYNVPTKFVDNKGATSPDQCHGCPPGKYLDYDSRPPRCNNCPNGYYCPGTIENSVIRSCWFSTSNNEVNSGVWGGAPSEVTGRTKVSDCW